MHDLILKNGRIYDGSGLPSFIGDVAIEDGRIAAIGRVNDAATQVLDTSGLAVAPGLIDFHTHFDAQLMWDPLASSSSEHGVTTVVTGNCGLTLAPCRPEGRDALISTFVRVEAMPRHALQAGIPWEWSTHGEYLDALGRRSLAVNVATLIGHCAVRQYVMGEAAVERVANDEEINQMAQLVRDGMKAGAFGFSTNSNQTHYREDGKPVASRFADLNEIAQLSRALGESSRGIVQFTHGAFATPEHVAQLKSWYDAIPGESGRPLIGESIRHRWSDPDLWRKQLDDVEARVRRGAAAYAMTSTRLAIRRWSFKEGDRFDALPTWNNVMLLPIAERQAQLRDAGVRARLAGEMADRKLRVNFSRRWDLVFVNKTKVENLPCQGKSVAEIAKSQGKADIDALLDLALSEGLDTVFEDSVTQGDENAVREIFQSPYVLLGQSDAGAHVASGNPGFGYGTFLLSYWVRQRGLMSLEEAIKKLTFMPASVFGFHDRGLLRAGMAADVFVFDPATIDQEKPERVNDLPEAAPRFVQHAKGVHYTIVNGKLLMKNGAHTGSFAGKVLRSY